MYLVGDVVYYLELYEIWFWVCLWGLVLVLVLSFSIQIWISFIYCRTCSFTAGQTSLLSLQLTRLSPLPLLYVGTQRTVAALIRLWSSLEDYLCRDEQVLCYLHCSSCIFIYLWHLLPLSILLDIRSFMCCIWLVIIFTIFDVIIILILTVVCYVCYHLVVSC